MKTLRTSSTPMRFHTTIKAGALLANHAARSFLEGSSAMKIHCDEAMTVMRHMMSKLKLTVNET